MSKITRFQVNGLFGSRNVDLNFEDEALILVGPNGIGKSTVANIFYYFISRQWPRLLDYKFDSISLEVSGEVVTASRGDITGLSGYEEFTAKTSTSMKNRLQILHTNDVFEKFITAERLQGEFRNQISSLLNMPAPEVAHFHRFLLRRFTEDDLFSAPLVKTKEKLSRLIPGRVLYLPTYRRIEKDIRDIFPDFEERFRKYSNEETSYEYSRSGNHYVELVSFGMEDVRKNLLYKTEKLRDYSLGLYNNLSANYLKDVIRGKADQFVAKEINHLDDQAISLILDRVNEDSLPVKDKRLLREKIKTIQTKRKLELETNEKYLAHYFTKLKEITTDIQNKESDITAFVGVCNKYMRNNKRMVYNELKYTVSIIDDAGQEIDLKSLSSGEKQVVSIFSHLYLESSESQILVIDEPELSLSVPWQKEFLPDILSTGRSSLILAVTHSPFIYENSLISKSIDLRKAVTINND